MKSPNKPIIGTAFGIIAIIVFLLVIADHNDETHRKDPEVSIENFIPHDADIVCKIDPKQFKTLAQKYDSLTNSGILRELSNLVIQFGDRHPLDSLEFVGFNYRGNNCLFLKTTNDTILLGIIKSNKSFNFDSKTSGTIDSTKWKFQLTGNILQFYDLTKSEIQDSTFKLNSIELNDQLLSAKIRNRNSQYGVVNITYSDTVLQFSGFLPINPDSVKLGSIQFESDEKSIIDLYLGSPKELKSILKPGTLLSKTLTNIENSIHIQYLGTGYKRNKFVTYEYDDNFEKKEIVSSENIHYERLQLLIESNGRENSEIIKDDIQSSIGFLFSNSKITDSTVIFSNDPISDLALIVNDKRNYAKIHVKLGPELKNKLPLIPYKSKVINFIGKGFDLIASHQKSHIQFKLIFN